MKTDNKRIITKIINRKQMNTKRNKNDMTYIDCPGPMTNLSLSKIGDFGQVQPLW